jgi:hypothetical protein
MAQDRWYPNLGSEAAWSLQNVIRRIMDLIYLQRDEMGPHCLFQRGKGTLTTGAAEASIPELKLVLDRAGRWLFTANICLTATNASGKTFTLRLHGAAEAQKPSVLARWNGTDIQDHMIGQWLVTAKLGDSFWLKIAQDTAGGTSQVDSDNSTIAAVWKGQA